MIYVTHDQVEAMTMADKIVVLNAGRIEQVGSPLELYNRPRNRFVAGFIGNPKMNFLEGTATRADGMGVTVDLGSLGTMIVPRPAPTSLSGQQVVVGVRPEHVSLGSEGFAMTLTPTLIERLGIHTIAYSPLADGENFIALFDGEPAVNAGQELKISIDPRQVHLFDTAGQAVGL
jgi:multiple sugar transport system ATP-binding protein